MFSVLAGLLGIALVHGCSSDSSGDAAPTSTSILQLAKGDGVVLKFTDGKVDIDVGSDSTGHKYVIQPFHVGAIATVNGAGTEKASFSYDGSGNLTLMGSSDPVNRLLQSSDVADRMLAKTIFNRFSSARGLEQVDGLWQMVDRFDKLTPGSPLRNVRSLRSRLTGMLGRSSHRLFQSTTYSSLAGCLTTDDEIELPAIDGEVNTTSIAAVTSGDGYCIVYELDPEADTKENIDASVASIMQTYKSLIYNDTWPQKGTFVFRPYIVIADLEGIDLIERLAGLFYLETTEKHQVPMLYLPYAFSDTNGLAGKDKRVFHATIAHELQHAIMYYYKGSPDALFIDEGFAHFMEDVFGFRGDGNFSTFTSSFLGVWSLGTFPFFGTGSYPRATDATDASVNTHLRGAAHSLFYYLSSQKGGLAFSEGKPTTSGGLTYVNAVMKSSTKGLDNIFQQFQHEDWDWLTTVGNYLGALALDNTGVSSHAQYAVQAKQSAVTDPLGVGERTYGFRFNNSDDIGTPIAGSTIGAPTAGSTVELEHYSTIPVVFSPADQSTKLTISSAADQAAVSVVRIE